MTCLLLLLLYSTCSIFLKIILSSFMLWFQMTFSHFCIMNHQNGLSALSSAAPKSDHNIGEKMPSQSTHLKIRQELSSPVG